MRSSILFLTTLSIIGVMSSCVKDSCNSTRLYRTYTPIYKQMDEVRELVNVESPRAILNPGKIYVYGSHLFLNDRGIGVHVIDVSDENNPVNQAFIQIPGNVDVTVNGNLLYADNFVDLVSFDISDINAIKEVGRVEDIFPDNVSIHETAGYWLVDRNQGVAVDWLEEEVEVECYEDNWLREDVVFAVEQSSNDNAGVNYGGGGNPSGTAGSMARFALMSGRLYVIDLNGVMRLFDLSTPEVPTYVNTIEVEQGIETIFPYYRDGKGYLFIGANNGMFIYDNADPNNPSLLSKFVHVNSCDPVVAEGNIAYVTLRSGTECQGFTNELQLIDISDLSNPNLIETYDMYNPHGLGIDEGLLFLCDGSEGLKIYDLRQSIERVTDKELKHNIKGIFAYDVIPYNGTLVLSSDIGFHLIDYSNVNDIHLSGEIITSVE